MEGSTDIRTAESATRRLLEFPTFGSDKEGVTDPRGHNVRASPTVRTVRGAF